VKRLALGACALLLAFGAVTLVALEASDVAVLVTPRPGGGVRETHVWWADDDGGLLVEAATPERAWLAEAEAAGEIDVVRDGRRERFRVERSPAPGAHDRLRALLRAKYGWRDAWVGLLQDSSRSVAVRLTPRDGDVRH
jgi:hypothetical protein